MFSLNGSGSMLSCDLFPPLDVSDGVYEIGLVDLTTYNSIPNIEKGVNDKFYYGDSDAITIEEGSYEIEDLRDYIRKETGISFSLEANNNTLQASIKCERDIHFEKPNSIGNLLGFENKVYRANKVHVSTHPINIIKVDTIRVDCNIVRGSYHNGAESHIIHEFYPTVAPGYKIVEVPTTIIYLPLNVQRINNITVTLRDQNGDLVNFRKENVALRLHLKQRHGSSI